MLLCLSACQNAILDFANLPGSVGHERRRECPGHRSQMGPLPSPLALQGQGSGGVVLGEGPPDRLLTPLREGVQDMKVTGACLARVCVPI